MASYLYVKGYNSETTLVDLIIYFQSKESRGGDIDDEECKFEKDEAILAFDEEEDLQRALKIHHVLKGSQLTISRTPFKPKPKTTLRKKQLLKDETPPKRANNKPIIDEIKTVIVTGISPQTTDNTLQFFFANKRRSGGGDIENLQRIDPQVAHVTFTSAQVASCVLEKRNLEIDGYLLRLNAKKPKVIYPKDTSKLVVHTTTNYGLTNYVELITGLDVNDLVFGNDSNALVTLDDEPDMNKVTQKAKIKRFEGAMLRISNPPICHSVLMTGFNKETTKNAIEIKFANPKYGGGEILDVVYQQEEGKAVIYFFDPNVIESIISKEQSLNGAMLTVRPYYPFLDEKVVDVARNIKKVIQVSPDIMDHVSNCEKIQVYEEYSKISEEHINLSKRQEDYLMSSGLEKINDDLKKRNLNALVCLHKSKPRKVIVELLDLEKFEEVKQYLLEQVFEESFRVEEESVNLLKSEEWSIFQETLEKESGVKISTVGHVEINIWITGETNHVKKACDLLKHFVTVNTTISESIVVAQTIARHLSRYCDDKMKNIEDNLKSHMVKLRRGERSFTVQGTKEGVNKAKGMLQDIVNELEHRKITVEKPGMQKYLVSESGKVTLAGIETRYSCSINLTTDKTQISTQISTVVNPSIGNPSRLLICSYETPEKMLFKVFQADITTHCCDVIVNTANGDLQHIGGLAKMIVDKGGMEIQEDCNAYKRKNGTLYPGECYKGIPGNLPCKHVVHTVGPRWDNNKQVRGRRQLVVACENTFQAAKNHSSIALPCVGSGINQIPKDVCAEVLVKAAVNFSFTNGGKSLLKEVHFVNNDLTTVKTFLNEFRKRFGDKPTFEEGLSSPPSRGPRRFNKNGSFHIKSTNKKSLHTPLKADTTTTITKTTISVIVGDLSTHQADVLVNTTNKHLKLESNPCSRAISTEAGSILQRECEQVGKLNVGEVAFTKGGNLLCKEVCHVRCTQWNKGQGEDVLRLIVQNCLTQCQSRGMKSIAFPAIGTGTLGFPHDVTAKICFEECKEFDKKNPNTCLKDIQFVVYHQDQASIKAFKEELKREPGWKKTPNEVSSREDHKTTGKSYGNFMNWQRSDFGSTGSKKKYEWQKPKLFLEIFAEKVETLTIVVKQITRIMDEQMKNEVIEDDLIKKLSYARVFQIMNAGKENNVEVKIQKSVNRIIVHGHTFDVPTVIVEIKSILSEVKSAEINYEMLFNDIKVKVNIPVPDYWDPQPIDANGKEIPLHIVHLDQTKHSKEYKKIVDSFLQTASNHTILKIERIQNPPLFKLYTTKKQSMDEQDGSNERILYHGTAADNVSDINQNGLNRSYNGVNGSAFGNGIYFATKAKHSAGYAKPDALGTRYMYVARVAAGEFTVGNPRMKVLPSRTGNIKYDSSVNNVANPSIFIMFYDNQYYTEHLITFR